MSERKLPNLIIAGVVKAGTTSIYSYFSRHPDICCSSIKETCYFSGYRYYKPIEPFEKYEGYFTHCAGQKYIMEATPGYFEGGKRVATQIKEQVGDIKILIVLRDPIDRLLSFVKYHKSMVHLEKDLSFDQYIKMCEAMPFEERVEQDNDRYWGIDGGMYSNYIEDWFEVFGDKLKIAFFDDLKKDSLGLLKDLSQWLEIDYKPFEEMTLEVENKSVNYKNKVLQQLALTINTVGEKFWRANPELKTSLREAYYKFNGAPHKDKISDEMRAYLKTIYAPYNKKLKEQLISHGYTNLPKWIAEA